jgi:hypothetical protein
VFRKKWSRPIAVLAVTVLGTSAAAAAVLHTGNHGFPLHRNVHAQTLNGWVFKNKPNEASRAAGPTAADPGEAGGPQTEAYQNRAYPATSIGVAQIRGALNAFQTARGHGNDHQAAWELAGPSSPLVPGLVANAGYTDTFQSGRATSFVVAPNCSNGRCSALLGTAGGGVWSTDNALSKNVSWRPASDGLFSSAVGSLAYDPGDRSGQTVYVGTGESNGSSDSEAGAGLYRSTDGGRSWSIVIGSVPVAVGRSIGAVAVDPSNPRHIFIGTDVARHGASSVIGGRFTPPGAAQIGLYESVDGGNSFSLAYSEPSDAVDPTSPNGSDFFRGGVSNIQFDPIATGRVWFSIFDYGLYRSKTSGGYEKAFASPSNGDAGDSANARTEFALAANGPKLRVYLGDVSSAYGVDPESGGVGSRLYRTDDAEVAAPVWTRLTAADNYCGLQCSYDMPLGSPAGQPNELWAGGTMAYSEIAGVSNGRAVIRTTDGGATFTDMTLDSNKVALHPDNHAIAFGGPGIAFIASDGGIVHTNGKFSDTSADCSDTNWHTAGFDASGPVPLTGADLATCQAWLKSTPDQIVTMNDGLSTLQFQSLSVNPNDSTDIMGGTQDNGTWSNRGPHNSWFETIGGDGGQSGIGLDGVRMHTYFGAQVDVNFHGVATLGWDWTGDLLGSEPGSFYIPLIADPKVAGSWYLGQQHVWRTQDNGGPQATLDHSCGEYTGDLSVRPCGDWAPIGPKLTSTTFGADKLAPTDSGNYVVAIARASAAADPSGGILWAATRQGRVFVSQNANAAAASVAFRRIDTPSTPTRFVSGISVDPSNPYHAFVSYSGYNAYAQAAGTAPGHVFEVTYNPVTHTATWNDISYDVGDQPITGVAYDGPGDNLYISTDWGVLQLQQHGHSNTWAQAAPGLPLGAVYGLTIAANGRVMYAATHGRSAWRLDLSGDKDGQNNGKGKGH